MNVFVGCQGNQPEDDVAWSITSSGHGESDSLTLKRVNVGGLIVSCNASNEHGYQLINAYAEWIAPLPGNRFRTSYIHAITKPKANVNDFETICCSGVLLTRRENRCKCYYEKIEFFKYLKCASLLILRNAIDLYTETGGASFIIYLGQVVDLEEPLWSIFCRRGNASKAMCFLCYANMPSPYHLRSFVRAVMNIP